MKFMNESNIRAIIAMIMAFIMTFSLFAIELQATEEESYTMITSLSDIVSGGRYLLTRDAVYGSGLYRTRIVAMVPKYPAGSDSNFDYYNCVPTVEITPPDGLLWIIETFGDGYSIRKDGGGTYDYINIGVSNNTLTLGARQALAIDSSGETFTISNGSQFIRFTNAYTTSSGYITCFQSSTATLMRDFQIYRYGSDVVEPTQTPEPIATTSKAVRVNDTTVVLKISTDADIPDDNLIHVALYDENDMLLDYILVPILKEEAKEEFSKFYVVLKDNNNADYAKVFIWKDSMEPVSVVDKVLISEIE